MASITKTVTALVVLKAKPLAPGEDGPQVTFTAEDEALRGRSSSRTASSSPRSPARASRSGTCSRARCSRAPTTTRRRSGLGVRLERRLRRGRERLARRAGAHGHARRRRDGALAGDREHDGRPRPHRRDGAGRSGALGHRRPAQRRRGGRRDRREPQPAGGRPRIPRDQDRHARAGGQVPALGGGHEGRRPRRDPGRRDARREGPRRARPAGDRAAADGHGEHARGAGGLLGGAVRRLHDGVGCDRAGRRHRGPVAPGVGRHARHHDRRGVRIRGGCRGHPGRHGDGHGRAGDGAGAARARPGDPGPDGWWRLGNPGELLG
ncbi:hypothetical protein BC477_13580 [Clavibacter michiganensis subsp. michiganensis]|uniref:D-alanyl-D-alanine carboxypeptidase n=1 Tax=Clavibacter michiganensis subsp. michiganensis TaxID=33013 RepID=A0A251XI52_CLAMM|nr:hypothetical protein BC477_13580 [Clavibacter michiganensis subsp. michiganensis]OUE02828.1 hypothetical protein CMMCAS07_12485 [Clavibacter michiganensis subsp. michiganensis]